MELIDELKWRGLVKDVTDYEGLTEALKTPQTVYCGFDPTADSLHVGHLQQIILLRRYQKAGHRPIALCGGFTGMIGDPRPTTERKLLSHEEVMHNADCIKDQLAKFLSFDGGNAAVMENNNHWLGQMSLLSFLRDYGKLFNVAYMLQKDTIKKRMDSGLSYTEFSYTMLQAMDFLQLYEKYNCRIQIGGSDQWGNLTSGMELIRKVKGEDAKVWGITSPLITKSDGTKFGKSEGKNIWLDPNRTSAYEFYQFWLNIPDADIIDYLKRLSMHTPEEITGYEKAMEAAPEKREAQKALAQELTEIVHGSEGLAKAERITETFFHGDIMSLAPEEIKEGLADAAKCEITDGTGILDALIKAGACSSKGDARRLVQQGSISVNGRKVTAIDEALQRSDAVNGEFSILKKGKKNYFVITF
ncbi:MAG: tyrosine--tRNA ligase [Solobacterium sp.]|nr:tyrosine--tRNA ligase [Solobacterium sp.]MCH4205225.1 tyrosine--tRNA ligase [Solobacterium sp.]MCH4226818.1 tyrosine--tRNA ligase [Solobacterium sp.]MCH4281578.1 tyrosine--tRNA ligase [Solobacterium sp.]